MPRSLLQHYGRHYGARTRNLVGAATALAGLGQHFGGDLYEAEVRYLIAHEWARTAEDVLTRRTKHNLHLTAAQQAAFTDWMQGA
jgi:glycerol-3-phosphate dehydrogenase